MDNSVHVARILIDASHGFDPLSGSMTDEIVVGSCRRNPDGTLTIRCQISVTDSVTGERWCLDDRKIRLPRIR